MSYKFGKEGQKGIANHILYFSPSSVAFEVVALSEDYITKMAQQFKWQVRTGRRKAAKQSSEEKYQGLESEHVTGKINVVEKAFPNIDIMKEFSKRKMFLKTKDGINQFNYEFLRKLADRADAKTFDPSQPFDVFFKDAWKDLMSSSNIINVGDEVMFKGRSGRFATDKKGHKQALDKDENPIWVNTNTKEEKSLVSKARI